MKAARLLAIVAFVVMAMLLPFGIAVSQVAPTNSAAITGTVTNSGNQPISNVLVTLSGPKSVTTRTDQHGQFSFVGMPFGEYRITAEDQQLGTARQVISVEGDTNVGIQFAALPSPGLKVIANVSTSASAKFNVTEASVTRVSPIAAAFNGQTSWRKILERIPGISQGSFGNGAYPNEAITDSPLMPIQVSINGALPYETATLLDDMPLVAGGSSIVGASGGSGANLAFYPLNAFSAADVIRGPGANAPSIVNSIGGSLVLHSPAAPAKSSASFSISSDPYGGVVANALTALRSNRLSAVVTYGINDSPGPVSGNYLTARTYYAPISIDGRACKPPTCGNFAMIDPNYTFGALFGWQTGLLECCFNISTAWSQRSGSISLGYDLSQSSHLSVLYAGSSASMSGPLPLYESLFTPPAGYNGPIPSGTSSFFLSTEFLGPDPYQQSSSLLEEKLTTQIGQGTLRLAALQNRTFETYDRSSATSASVQLYGGALICTDTSSKCASGSYVPTIFNGDVHTAAYPAIYWSNSFATNNFDLLASYATQLGSAAHAGASFVRSYYDVPTATYIKKFTPPSRVNFEFPGVVPPDVAEVTNEARFFVGADPTPKTTIDLSMYFTSAAYHVQNPDDPTGATYSDVKYSYSAPRLGGVWRPSPSIAARASVGGGFATAPLTYLIGTNSGVDCSSGTSCMNTVTNLDLHPETSFSFDVGADFRLPQSTVLSFDIYRSTLHDQLYYSTVQATSCSVCSGLPYFITQYGNLGTSRYEGLLLDLRHDPSTGVYWSFSGGLTRGYVVNVPAGFYDDPSGAQTGAPCTQCVNTNVMPGVNFNGTYTNGVSVPYSQALGTVGYRWNAEKYADVVATYFGANNSYNRPAFLEADAHLSLPLSPRTSLLLTARNVTGIYDHPYAIVSDANLIGVPAVAGAPYYEYGQEYGPRTVVLTLKFSP